MDELVEQSLRGAALWDEVKDKLKESAMALSGGQQQRLCIARASPPSRSDLDGRAVLGARPDRHDEDRGPDAASSRRVHDRDRDPQHAAGRARVRPDGLLHGRGGRRGQAGREVVEFDETETIFTNPTDKRTEDYVTGRFG